MTRRSGLFFVILRRDFLEGLGFLLFSGIIFLFTSPLTWDAALFPRTMAAIIAFVGCVLLYNAIGMPAGLMTKQKASSDTVLSRGLVATITLLCFWGLHQTLGFYASSFLFAIAFFLFFDRPVQIKTVIKAVIFSLILNLLLYVLFYRALRLMTPDGLLA